MMSKLNKTTSAPFGMAFIFLAITSIPISLKVVGVDIKLSPKVAAVVGAWEQIAGTFGNSYQPLMANELAELYEPDKCKATDSREDGVDQNGYVACVTAPEENGIDEVSTIPVQPEISSVAECQVK